ncbi:MAG: CDP-diacylglycerol--glycerol-3-phosphate 3-phosphatidyltransferase [Candidatus Omnitrophica bacterium]|nr:CDP-diacylglycerol--glycerol-3-phosphate 3-phosphatidyltransferase [Candidatus Omnitrophota bacterium]
MNLPNKITLSRIVLAFIFMFLLFCQGVLPKYLALFTFCIACLTDYVDGRIARSRNLENNFGRLMDPIADKVLILAAFLSFVEMKIIPAWMVIVIIFRELVITGLRIIAAARRGVVISASLAGKHKTVSQMAAIISILIFIIIRESAQELWTPAKEVWFKRGAFYLMLLTVVLTLISGISYLVRNRNILFSAHEKSD